MATIKRRIAPRLADGSRRESYSGRLPSGIKAGLKLAAQADGNSSMSWTLERIITYLLNKHPEYVQPKQHKIDTSLPVLTVKPRKVG